MDRVLEVRSRKLEQFIFAHGIDFLTCRKDPDDGMTVWTYEVTEELLRIQDEFRLALKRRQKKGA